MQKRSILAAAAFAAAAVTTQGAFAQSNWGSPFSTGPYIGASGGQSKFRTQCSSLFNCDTKDTAWKLYGGGRYNDVFGFEAGYTDFGRINTFGGDTKAWAANLSALIGVPFGDRFNVFAKGGALYGRTDVNASPSTLFDTGHKNGWGATYGVGAAVSITKAVQARIDWDRYKLDFVGGRRDVDMLSAGLQMRF